MKGKVKIKTIIVVVILILVGVLGLLGVNTVRTYVGTAAGGADPKNVEVKVDDDGRGATVSWMSDKETMGIVEYGTTPASLLLRAVESDATASHRVVLAPLKPGVNYYFRIRVGDDIFDNGGIPYSFKTTATIVATPTAAVTLVPTLAPTSGASSGCNRTTDYNGDGKINSLDYVTCTQSGGNTGDQGAGGTSPGCDGVDFDGNGVINSIDRIKCLQAN